MIPIKIAAAFLSMRQKGSAVVAKVPESIWNAIIILCVGCGGYIAGHFLGEHDGAKRVTAMYNEQIDVANRANTAAFAQQAKENKETLAAIGVELADAKLLSGKVQTIIKEKKVYVTAKADAQCTITDGFVWMLDASLATKASAVPTRGPLNVDAPAPIKISEVAGVVAANNAECVQRGVVISAWQEWYIKAKDSYERASAIIVNAQPALFKGK